MSGRGTRTVQRSGGGRYIGEPRVERCPALQQSLQSAGQSVMAARGLRSGASRLPAVCDDASKAVT